MKSFKRFLAENEQMMLFPMDQAAAAIHDSWMSRNPQSPLHVPYDQLPEAEKEKDRQHIETVKNLLGTIKVPESYSEASTREAHRLAVASAFGAMQHDLWRGGLPDTEKFNPDGSLKPRIREKFGVMVDVNKPWDQLEEPARRENYMAGLAAYDAYKQFIGDPIPTAAQSFDRQAEHEDEMELLYGRKPRRR